MSDPSLFGDEYDPFKGGTGLREGPAVVVESWFSTDPQYNQGKTLCLMLKKVFDDGEELTDRYPCGSDFASYDDGETAEHPKDTEGKKVAYNVQSAIMELVNAAFSCGNVVDHTASNAAYPEGRPVTDVELMMRTVSRDKFGGMGPRAAGIWRGTKWEWVIKTETKKFKDRETQEMIERTTNRSLPVSFLGIVELTDVPGDEWKDASVSVGAVSVPPPPPAPVVQNTATQTTTAPVAPPPAPVPPVPPIPQPPSIPQPQQAAEVQPQPTQPEPTSAPAPEPAAAPETPLTTPLSLLDPTVAAQVRLLAQSQPYHEWVDSVMAIQGIAAIPEFVMSLADDSLYNALHAG